MINAEQIYYKAQSLDAVRLQELEDFLDFLLSKNKTQHKTDVVFSETQLEAVTEPSVYHGKPLTEDDMNQAVEWEAGQSL
jgi:hypothetical protein